MFRRLTRHFAAGLVDNDLMPDGQDLHASIAGILAALLVISAGVALMCLGKYNSVVATVHGRLTAQFQTLPEKLAMALDDKALLLGGAMILMGLLTAVFWDTLALDERDLAVMGPLPVRPATVLLAKAVAVTGAAAILAVALNALPSLLFPVVVLLEAPVGPGDVVRAIAAHAIAGMAGCAFVFFTLSSCRGLAGLFGSGSLVRRWLPLAQFVLVLGLLSALFALPVMAGKTRHAIEAGSHTVMFYPPLWFLGLEEGLIGRTDAIFANLARVGLAALCGSLAAACFVHACGLLRRAHRPGAESGSPTSPAGRVIAAIIERLALLLSTDGRVRASFVFTARTLTRNPRHRLYLAGSLGVGLAVAAATIPINLKYMGLAAQLNLVFFLVVGLRIAATIPADLEAGWVFRFLATPARERHVAGTRGAVFFVAVLPLLVVLAPLHVWLWGWYAAAVHLSFGVVAALGLLEIVFTDYARMPFVSSFTPGKVLLSPRFGLYAFDYALFAYLTPAIEQFLIDRTALFYTWTGLLIVVVSRFIRSLSTRARRDEMPVFDAPAIEMEQLGLWNAVHAKPVADAGPTREPAGLFESVGRKPVSTVEVPRRSWTVAAQQLWRDVVYAVRRLRANPGFTAFSVATLALGIGATTALYSVIYSTILRPLHVRDLGTVVNIYHASPLRGSRWFWTLSLPDFEDLRKTQTVFSAVAAHAPFGQIVIANGVGEKARGEAVSGDYFRVLGIQPAAGRLLQPADDRPGVSSVVVIDESVWRRRFDGRHDIAGQILRMAGRDFEIVGVAPAGFHGVELPNLAPTTMWVPLEAAALVGAVGGSGLGADFHDNRERRWLVAHGRLSPGRSVAQAQAELRVIGRRLDETHPIGLDLPPNVRSPPYVSRPWVAVPAADRLVSEQADPGMLRMARLTMVAVTLVLLVACTNLANLTLARGVSRKRDLAVRLALGASRWQLVREQLVESAILALLGAAAALTVARVVAVYGSSIAVRLGGWMTVQVAPTLDRPVALVGIAATALALIVFGLVPALQLAGRGVSLVGGAADSGAAGTRWQGRRLLIASQVAVSVALVAIASLCARHVVAAASRDTGIDLDRLALVRFDFRIQGWTEERARRAMDRLAQEAGRQNGIEAVAIVSGLPLHGFGRSANLATPDRPFAAPGYNGQGVTWIAATPLVFRALGVPIVAGRSFDERDTGATVRTIVLSERAARGLFDAADVVGRRVLRRSPSADGRTEGVETLTVIGVSRDTDGDGGPREGTAYVPFSQYYEPFVSIAARTFRSPNAAVGTLQAITHRLEPELGVIDAGTGTEIAGVENLAFEIMGALSGLLGVLAMALAMAGLYGVLSYVVAQRTHEMGVRVALGASATQIMRLVVLDGVRPVVEGLVVGFVVADLAEMAMRPAMSKPLPAIDATLMALVPLPFLIVALLACYLPSRRAAAVDPNVALRHT